MTVGGMFSNDHTAEVFGFIAAAHPFAPVIEAFRAAIRTAPQFAVFTAAAAGAAGDVHADLKAECAADGAWALERCYWCFQPGPGDAASAGEAHMLYWKRGADACVVSFPDDPSLPAMAPFLAARRAAGVRLDVLRYVPLRRLTFRERGAGGEPDRIGKLKRRRLIRASYERLAAVHRAASAAQAGFAVAAPLALDEDAGVFYQQALAGRALASGMEPHDAAAQLSRVGRVHRQLHALDVPDVPGWSLQAYFDTIGEDVHWIALFRPQAAARLQPVLARLAASMPDSSPGSHVFCHGDFIPSQLLIDGDRVAVTDFDGARRGDAHQEMAKLLAALKYDLPHLRAALQRGEPLDTAPMRAAEAAYLAGYEGEHGAPVDRARLPWFRTCAEIHYLAMTLKKDAWSARAFEHTLELVEACAAPLGA
ncbi:MAG TPA: aminoglycoside phosphotransferase family protein [Albitalea sp.]